MKILVADKISPKGIQVFKDQGYEVLEAYGSDVNKILELIKDADGLVVRSETKATKEVFLSSKQLKVVGRAGVGVDNIDIDAATDKGVIVMNTPSGNTKATAELTFTHMLAGARPIVQSSAVMTKGGWDRKNFTGSELNGKTLGILGMGRIGAEVSKRAKAFNMEVLAFDPYLTEAKAQDYGVKLLDFESVIKNADYITVHMPLNSETKHIISEDAFKKMKKGVKIYNCARGGIIDEEALVKALESGHVEAAGLDVYEEEPPDENSKLRKISNLVLTPHLGASTEEAQENVGIDIAKQMVQALNGGMVINALNMPSVDPAQLKRLSPYIKLTEKMGAFVNQLGPDGIEKIVIKYYGKIIDFETLPLTNAVQRGFLKEISDHVNDVNAPSKINSLGIQIEEVKSMGHNDFNELIEVSVINSKGENRSVSGSLFGKHQTPRIVLIDSFSLEINANGILLVLKNNDVPGIVGFVGKLLGECDVNIANMSLSRDKGQGFAVSVFELDSIPSEKTLKKIIEHKDIEKYKVINL